MKKIIKIVVWDELSYSKVFDMVKLSFKYHNYIDITIGDDNIKENDMLLYIGFNSTILNTNFKNIDITDNKIYNDCYWSFGYDEDRILFGKYLKKFVSQLIKSFFDTNIPYEIIDYQFNKNGVINVDSFINYYEDKINNVFSTGLSYYFNIIGSCKIYNISLKMIKFYEDDKIAEFRNFMNHNNSKLMNLNSANEDYIEFKNSFSEVLDNVLTERYYLYFV